MKKLTGIIVMVAMLVGLMTGCGTAQASLAGTWSVESVDLKGSNYTISELENMGDDSLSDLYIVLKDGGSAYVHSGGQGSMTEWGEATAGSVKIGVQDCKIENDMILLEINESTVYLSKTSDSQTIPEN